MDSSKLAQLFLYFPHWAGPALVACFHFPLPRIYQCKSKASYLALGVPACPRPAPPLHRAGVSLETEQNETKRVIEGVLGANTPPPPPPQPSHHLWLASYGRHVACSSARYPVPPPPPPPRPSVTASPPNRGASCIFESSMWQLCVGVQRLAVPSRAVQYCFLLLVFSY